MTVGGRQRSLARMVDRVWYQAITFKTSNNLKRMGILKNTVVVYKYVFDSCGPLGKGIFVRVPGKNFSTVHYKIPV